MNSIRTSNVNSLELFADAGVALSAVIDWRWAKSMLNCTGAFFTHFGSIVNSQFFRCIICNTVGLGTDA